MVDTIQAALDRPWVVLQHNDAAFTVELELGDEPIADWAEVAVEVICEAREIGVLTLSTTGGQVTKLDQVGDGPTSIEVTFAAGTTAVPATGSYVVDVIHPDTGRRTCRCGPFEISRTRADGVLSAWRTDSIQAAIDEAVAAAILANGASGRELAVGESTAQQLDIADVATVVTDCELVDLEVGDRPVDIEAQVWVQCADEGGTVWGAAIVDENGVQVDGSLVSGYFQIVNQPDGRKWSIRVATPGTYTFRLVVFMIYRGGAGGGTVTVNDAGDTTRCAITAVER